MAAEIILVVGCTGAGKTTYARQLADELGGLRFSIDEWMMPLFGPDVPQPIQFAWMMERVNRCEAMIWIMAQQSVARGVPAGEISVKFHNALAEAVVGVARQVEQLRVALSGGCFQNRYLTERTVNRLRAEGFRPYWHQRVPPNDGGIAFGQAVAVRRMLVNCKS